MEESELLPFENTYYELKNYRSIKCTGADCERFLNGQLTNDVKKLKDNSFQQQVRLSRSGQIQYFFYLLKQDDCFFILIDKENKKSLSDDLDKYIIMDDVELNSFDCENISILFSSERDEGFYGIFAHRPAFIILNFSNKKNYKHISEKDYESLTILGGEPVWNVTIHQNRLVTDSIAMLRAVSLDKGCFLGQETVAKIESRRGGAYFPVILKSLDENLSDKLEISGKSAAKKMISFIYKNSQYHLVNMYRDFRVKGKQLLFDDQTAGVVSYLPFWDYTDEELVAQMYFEKGIEVFQEGDNAAAIEFLKKAIAFKPDYADAYESLGVLYGREENFQMGIELMNELEKIDPDSVMEHTNKSLFYMKLGKIEEAEEEKAQATVKSFSSFGKEAKRKKDEEGQINKDKEENLRREQMFRDVLEIDSEDDLANFGLAEIEFKRENYKSAIDHCSKVLAQNEIYSAAYKILAKSI